jgi:hypothetical protein
MQRLFATRLFLALLLGALTFLVVVPVAYASHTRPKGATPKLDSFVIAYEGCAAPNAIHAPPFAFRSCNPPKPSSPWLTVGTLDSNGLPANFIGSSRLDVCPACPDINVKLSLTDVRCTADLAAATPAVCPNGTLGAYSGTVAAVYPVRLTDHCNDLPPGVPPACPAPPGLPATVQEFDFPIKFGCSPFTVGGGSTCQITTTFNTVLPGAMPSGQRMNIQIGAVRVIDGGKDGDVSTQGNTTFVEQGVFNP